MARFHGGHLDGQLISPWPEPPGRSVWAQPGVDGAIVTDSEPQDPGDRESPGFDHYVLTEVVADLAVYHFAEPS